MNVDASYDVATLHAMGATRVAEVRDDAGILTGYDVWPEINLAGYDSAFAQSVAAVKRGLAAEIDAAAEAERLKYITGGAGQAMTYAEKAAQAKACLADESPEAGDYPMLAAEIGITGADLAAVASVVNTAYQQWLTIGSQIEAVRLGGKAAVNAAATAQAARTAFAAISWP